MASYATADEFKAMIDTSVTDVADDAFIVKLLAAASHYIDIYTGRTFVTRTETRKFDTPTGEKLYLDDDLLTVTSITNGASGALTAGTYVLLPTNLSPKHSIKLKTGSWDYDASGYEEEAISVAGTWGYSTTCPDDIRQACLSISLNWYRKRYGGGTDGAAVLTAAGVVITPNDIPKDAASILALYQRLF